jgi:hypothetical protein
MLADRDRHQARQQGPGPVQAEALRLQQRADRGLQVPLDVHRPARCRAASKLVTKGDPRVTRVGRFIRKTRSTNCRSSSTCSRATCRWSARARMPSGQGRGPALRRGRRRLLRPPQGEARHHRLGADQRLARRDRHTEKIQRASSTTSTTSRTGRCFDLYILAMTPVSFVITGLAIGAAVMPLAFLLILLNLGFSLAVIPVLTEQRTLMWVLVRRGISRRRRCSTRPCSDKTPNSG